MHPTAMKNAQDFFAQYAWTDNTEAPPRVVDIGAQDVNGSLRAACPPNADYVGVDFVAGKGVDVVLSDPYQLPFESQSVDVVLSSSCFEHTEMFWIMFLEVMRILKSTGLFYLNVPANGDYHRWPVDCWRFYPDSGHALVTWAKRNGLQPTLLESYTSLQVGDQWNDFVAVFLKDERFVERWPRRILDSRQDFVNGWRHGTKDLLRCSLMPEDKVKMAVIRRILDNQVKVL